MYKQNEIKPFLNECCVCVRIYQCTCIRYNQLGNPCSLSQRLQAKQQRCSQCLLIPLLVTVLPNACSQNFRIKSSQSDGKTRKSKWVARHLMFNTFHSSNNGKPLMWKDPTCIYKIGNCKTFV